MKKYYLLFFFLIFHTNSFAEENVFYLDVKFLLSESDSGKYINNELKKMIKDNPNILTNKQNGIVRTGIRKLLSKEYNDIEKCIKKL